EDETGEPVALAVEEPEGVGVEAGADGGAERGGPTGAGGLVPLGGGPGGGGAGGGVGAAARAGPARAPDARAARRRAVGREGVAVDPGMAEPERGLDRLGELEDHHRSAGSLRRGTAPAPAATLASLGCLGPPGAAPRSAFAPRLIGRAAVGSTRRSRG